MKIQRLDISIAKKSRHPSVILSEGKNLEAKNLNHKRKGCQVRKADTWPGPWANPSLQKLTEADSINDLHVKIRDAVTCHFEEDTQPKLIRLHHVKEEVIPA